MCAEEPLAVRLRPAGLDDAARLLEWRNDSEVREASFSTEPVTWSTHSRWLAAKLDEPGARLLVVEVDRQPAGQVRLERADGGVVEVHVALAPQVRGRGVGRRALDLAADVARAELGASELIARIRPGNQRSLQAFSAAGFTVRGREHDAVVAVREL
jgi:RimJ/RimL family protein N-acetyltransferase